MTPDLLIHQYKVSHNRLLLFDLDGTLVAHLRPGLRALQSKRTGKLLADLCRDAANRVVIVSERTHMSLDRLFHDVPVEMAAEYGAWYRAKGKWEKRVSGNSAWKIPLLELLDRFTRSCPNSYVQERQFSLSWHYHNSDHKAGYDHSRELIRILTDILPSYGLRMLDSRGALEIIPQSLGKGALVKDLLGRQGYDLVLAIGDDAADEEMFGALLPHGHAFTVKVGAGESLANLRLSKPQQVAELLTALGAARTS
jgi:trehalose 6-phosphate synthase/phosphatase